jgi:hypothetical protein
MSPILIVLIAVAAAILFILIIVSRLIYICAPNEVLIFSGAHRTVSETDQRPVGYRLVQGGRGIRVPIDRGRSIAIDLTNMVIDVEGAPARTRSGGIPLNVRRRRQRQDRRARPAVARQCRSSASSGKSPRRRSCTDRAKRRSRVTCAACSRR